MHFDRFLVCSTYSMNFSTFKQTKREKDQTASEQLGAIIACLGGKEIFNSISLAVSDTFTD